MQLGEQRNITNSSGHIIGFVRRTLGGFYRGYRYGAGIGFGPFVSEEAAERWVQA